MNKSELDSKSLAELHALAAEAGVERFRMLPRAELIAKLAGGSGGGSGAGSGGRAEPKPKREGGRESSRRGGRGGRDRGPREGKSGGDRGSREGGREERSGRERGERKPRERSGERRERKPREPRKPREETREERSREAEAPATPEPSIAPATTPPPSSSKRKRRRRRWGRRPKGIRVHDLLLPPAAAKRAIVYAETREGCTALLREVAAELVEAGSGLDPIALLIDPSPEELADWKREAPQAELVSAGQARHADDALAQATLRAKSGEDVIVLIDSLTRFAEDFAGADEARELFDTGLDSPAASSGSLTVVAAVQRPS